MSSGDHQSHCIYIKFYLYQISVYNQIIICRDMSNNSFNASEVLSWFSSLQSLTALYVLLSCPFLVLQQCNTRTHVIWVKTALSKLVGSNISIPRRIPIFLCSIMNPKAINVFISCIFSHHQSYDLFLDLLCVCAHVHVIAPWYKPFFMKREA